MKERNKQIDQIIQSKLNDYSSTSSEDLWDRIDAKRSKKDDAGIVWWRWSLAGMAILFVAIGLTLWSNGNDHTSITENTSNNLEKENVVTNNNAKNFTEPTSKAEDDLLLNIDDVTLNENLKKQTQTQVETKTQKTSSSSTILSSIDDSRNINTHLTTVKSKVAASTERISPDISIPNQESKISKYANTLTPKHQSINHKTEATPQNYLKAIYLPTDQKLLLELERTVDEDLLKIAEVETLPRGCYSFPVGAFKYDFYVDAIASIEYTTRTLKAKDNEFSDYARNREASESEMYSFSTGLRLSFVTEGGVALRTGLIYNQILERFKYVNGNRERWVFDVERDNQGNIISIDSTLETGTRIKTTYNRYRTFDIPLLLGYELHKKKIVYNINGGVYFNIWSKQKGEFLAPNANDLPIKFNSGNPTAEKIFHDRLGISFYGSLGFNYKLNDVLQLLIEPNIRYQFHSITVEDYPLEQKYMNIGLMTGLRLQF